MKKDTHPTYYPHAKITCSCGNILAAGSTIQTQQVEICSACHPFFTGKMKLIDTAGRVEKFKAKQKKADEIKNAPPQEKKAPVVSKKKVAVKKGKPNAAAKKKTAK